MKLKPGVKRDQVLIGDQPIKVRKHLHVFNMKVTWCLVQNTKHHN